MTISSNPGVPQQPMPGTYGSAENPIGNPANTTTTSSQGTKVLDPKDIDAARSNSANAPGATEYPSLPTPGADALEAHIDATFSKLETMDKKMVMLDMGAILGLMAKFAQEMRTTGRMDRAAQLENKLNQLLSAAEQIKTAGEDRYKSAMIAGALKIFSGVVQIGLSAAAFRSSMKGTDKSTAMATMLTSVGKGMDSIIDGISTMVTAGLNLDAARADAQRAVYDAKAQENESKAKDADDIFSRAMDDLRKTMEALQTQMQSHHETVSKIIGHI